MKYHEYYVIPRLKERNEVVQIEEATDMGNVGDEGEYIAHKTKKVVYRSTLADCYAYIKLIESDQLRDR